MDTCWQGKEHGTLCTEQQIHLCRGINKLGVGVAGRQGYKYVGVKLKMARLLLLAALAVLFPVVVYGAQCAQSEESMCVFTCNGTIFNLTEVFQYP